MWNLYQSFLQYSPNCNTQRINKVGWLTEIEFEILANTWDILEMGAKSEHRNSLVLYEPDCHAVKKCELHFDENLSYKVECGISYLCQYSKISEFGVL